MRFDNEIGNWHAPDYVGDDRVGLGEVMRSIVWSNPMQGYRDDLQLTLDNLQVGETYKAQLLFGEACCARGFDVQQDGGLLVDNFSPYALGGNRLSGSAFVANTFVASASSVTFRLTGHGGQPDFNPILNAATLERVGAVPEPTTAALVAIAALGAFTTRRRKGGAQPA